ncbi:hypothetical protein ACKKBG_A18480 [Auxenochlorella protothecoides x Auxenochlorella symbiontica]
MRAITACAASHSLAQPTSLRPPHASLPAVTLAPGPKPGSIHRLHLLRFALLAPMLSPPAVPGLPGLPVLQAGAAALADPVGAHLPGERPLTAVLLQTLRECQVAIGVYPPFAYDASGGMGRGTVRPRPDGLLDLDFDPRSLVIPSIDSHTTSVLGVPLPPPLSIAIQPLSLSGTLDPATGSMELTLDADFLFTAGPLYKAPPLHVHSLLSTKDGKGEALKANGSARLAGTATVPRTPDGALNAFLDLPTEALAVLSTHLTFV